MKLLCIIIGICAAAWLILKIVPEAQAAHWYNKTDNRYCTRTLDGWTVSDNAIWQIKRVHQGKWMRDTTATRLIIKKNIKNLERICSFARRFPRR